MTTLNSQDDELDKILNRLYRVSAETEYSRDRFEPFIFSGVDEAKAAIIDRHNKQLEQAVVEARIDELRLASDMQYMMRREDRVRYCSKRIVELKAQQEKE